MTTAKKRPRLRRGLEPGSNPFKIGWTGYLVPSLVGGPT